MNNGVLQYFWFSDKKEFNLYHDALYNMSNDDWNTIPCIVFLVFKENDFSRNRNNDTFLWLDKLGDLKNHKHLTSIYKIDAISFLHPETYLQYKSGLIQTIKKNTFKDGLYLLSNHYLFQKLVEPLL